MCVHAAVSAKMSKSQGALCCLKKDNSYLNKVIGWRNICILLTCMFDIIKVFKFLVCWPVMPNFRPPSQIFL